MLRRISKLKSHHQIIFALLIGFAVVCFWRGVWGLLDEFLVPQLPITSFTVSLRLGIIILLITDYLTKELM
mgnify:FL=1